MLTILQNLCVEAQGLELEIQALLHNMLFSSTITYKFSAEDNKPHA